MAHKGIIFSASMVRSLLAGRKTQTRRLCKNPHNLSAIVPLDNAPGWFGDEEGEVCFRLHYAPGDRLYVREAWSVRGAYTDVVEVGYRASERASHTEFVEQWPVEKAIPGKGKWPRWPNYGPSIHMPRWASRLWLAIAEVRVERLQSISETDAVAEGIDQPATAHFGTPIRAYAGLWDSLHGGESDHGWAANPWIVAISFTVNHGNIDR